MNLNQFTNAWITVFSILAVYLVGRKDNERAKWGPVLGIIGQPAWFYLAVTSNQWGIFISACAFTWVWIDGILSRWTNHSWASLYRRLHIRLRYARWHVRAKFRR